MLKRPAGELDDFSRFPDPDQARERAGELAAASAEVAEQARRKVAAIDDPVERAAAAETYVQNAIVQYQELVELRNDAIRAAFDASTSGRRAASSLIAELSCLTLQTPTQLRQIRAHDRLGANVGQGPNWKRKQQAVEQKLTKEYLVDARLERRLSMAKIADEAGVAVETVRRYLRKYDLPAKL